MTARCVYCGAELSDTDSLRRGYGLACAAAFRRPYGRSGRIPGVKAQPVAQRTLLAELGRL